VKISRFLKISEFTAAFIIMAFATSVPELFVGISSALSGNPALSLGNVIGANILDLTLILGIIVLVSKEIKITGRIMGQDIYFMLSVVALIIVLYLIGNSLSRIDGLILLSVFSFNIYRVIKRRKRYKAKINKDKIKKTEIVVSVAIFIVALLILFWSSRGVVKFASLLAFDLKLPQIIIGLFLLSIATTLPELVFGISASRLKHKEMIIGDQIGTIIANSGLIIGLVALIHPIQVELLPFLISSIFMFISAFIFVAFLKSGKKIETMEGISLILLYVLFLIIEFFTKPQ
jgi:cation:H+ antiporter